MTNLTPSLIREQVIKTIRSYFYELDFHEIIPPTLNTSIPIEPNIYPFTTTWKTRNQDTDLFLSTSPERGLKLMLAKGVGNCFAFGKCFRNLEGSGPKHIPEYLMLEWYREQATYHDIINDLQTMIWQVKQAIDRYKEREKSQTLIYQGKDINLAGEWPIYSLPTLFKTHTGLDMLSVLTEQELFPKAQEKGYHTTNATWAEVFDQIFVQEIESQMPLTPYVITDFPARLSPLCKKREDNPDLAERFEFFMAGMEIANGNNENTDANQIREYFEEEQNHRQKTESFVSPTDTTFLQAIENMNQSGKAYAGVGLGVDRLAMILADCTNVTDIEPLSVCSR
jgi:elongation factor P--beta-lysine ligase